MDQLMGELVGYASLRLAVLIAIATNKDSTPNGTTINASLKEAP
jgi:hypothetical protein